MNPPRKEDRRKYQTTNLSCHFEMNLMLQNRIFFFNFSRKTILGNWVWVDDTGCGELFQAEHSRRFCHSFSSVWAGQVGN